jgi:anti-anti-sigma factor
MAGAEVSVKFSEDCVIFYPHGYLNNLRGEKIEKRCEDVLREGYRKFVVNFQDSPVINSIGISFLIGMIDRINKSKGSICFSNLAGHNSEVFEFMGLTKFAPIFPNEEEAVRHAQQTA